MVFFEKIGAIVAFSWNFKEVMARMNESFDAIEETKDLEGCKKIAASFARAAHSAEKMIKSGGKYALISEGEDAKKEAESALRAMMGSLRLLSAYYFHVGMNEPLGDFVIDQGLEIEKYWKNTRQHHRKDEGVININIMIDNFAPLIVSSVVPVAMRALAEKLAFQGVLTKEKAEDLAERSRQATQFNAVKLRINANERIKKLSLSNSKDAEFKIKENKKNLASSLGGAMEESHIFFVAGMFDKAKVPIIESLALSTEQERIWAKEALYKEITILSKGNGVDFCNWVRKEFEVSLNKSEKDNFSPMKA